MKRLAVLIILTLVSILTLAPHPVSAAAYNPNNIIDDAVFDDTNTMSASQIDSFLNGFTYSCISPNSGFRATDPTGYNPTSGYLYGGYVTAGQVIYDAAQAYGINPQVILSTLQKEQSLVVGGASYCNDGDENKYAAAAGYGCPDSGTTYSYTGLSLYQRNGVTVGSTGTTCVNTASKAGFSQQVIRAAWLLKFGEQRSEGNMNWAVIRGNWDNSDDPQSCYAGPMTQGTFQRCPSGAKAYYDGYTTIDATSVHIDNGATAALYWYTPHFHGNQNFDTFFESWFGSLIGSYLVRTASSATVYLLSGTNKYPIADSNLLNDFSPLGYVKYVSDDYINAYTTGPTLSHMVGGTDGGLYFVNAGIKLPFSSCSSVADYGYDCSSVVYLTDQQLAKLATGPLATPLYKTTSGKEFYITSGTKREVFDQQSLTEAGISAVPNQLLEGGIAYLPYGSPVIRNDVVVSNRNDGAKYLYNSSATTKLSSDVAGLSYVKNLPSGSLDGSSLTSIVGSASPLNGYASDSSANKYALLNDGKVKLTSPSSWAPSYPAVSDSVLSAIPNSTQPLNNQLVKSAGDGTVYYITGGKKRPIPSWGDLTSLQISPLTISVMLDTELSQLPNGVPLYGIGSFVKTAGSGTVYIVESPTQLLSIASFAFPADLGLNSSIRTISDSDYNYYGTPAAVQTKLSCNGTDYVGINGKLYAFSPTRMTQFGFVSGDFVDAPQLCPNLTVSQNAITDYIRTPDGTIYLVSGGQKRAFTNFEAYQASGGTVQNRTEVSPYFASQIPSGANISQWP